MSRRTLGRRVEAIRARLDPQPDPTVLAYARAVIEFGGNEPTAPAAHALAAWLQAPPSHRSPLISRPRLFPAIADGSWAVPGGPGSGDQTGCCAH